MNDKRRCYDLARALAAAGRPILFAMSAERDPYVRHHRTFGGTAYVWLEKPADSEGVELALRELEGVENVLTRHQAAQSFRLHPDRIGDLMVLGDRDTVFGPLAAPSEDLPPGFRTHGSCHELRVRSSSTAPRHRPGPTRPHAQRPPHALADPRRLRVRPMTPDVGLVLAAAAILAFTFGLGVVVLRVPRCRAAGGRAWGSAWQIADVHPALIEVVYRCRACQVIVGRRMLGHPGD